jgi:hypothetical protein
VIFNYQSTARNPAVLTILVTRQGASLNVVHNGRDTSPAARAGASAHFFNAAGEQAPLTAERISDVLERGTTMNGESAASLGNDTNLLMLVQVPRAAPPRARRRGDIRATRRRRRREDGAAGRGERPRGGRAGPRRGRGTVHRARRLEVERDPRFPVRVTVQLYQATATGRFGDAEVAHLAKLVSQVYEKGDFVGSLVVPGPGDAQRPKAWDGASPPRKVAWWDFPGLLEPWRQHGPRRKGAGIR